jgi:hypothetical protein
MTRQYAAVILLFLFQNYCYANYIATCSKSDCQAQYCGNTSFEAVAGCKKACLDNEINRVTVDSVSTANCAPGSPSQDTSYYRPLEWCSSLPVPSNATYAGGAALGTNNHTGNRHGEVCFDVSRIGRTFNTWCFARQGSAPNQLCIGVETSSTCGNPPFAIAYLRRDGGHVRTTQACIGVTNQDSSQTRYFDVLVAPVR